MPSAGPAAKTPSAALGPVGPGTALPGSRPTVPMTMVDQPAAKGDVLVLAMSVLLLLAGAGYAAMEYMSNAALVEKMGG